jgi:hypothetical protein
MAEPLTTALDIRIVGLWEDIHLREDKIGRLREELEDLIVERYNAKHVEVVILPVGTLPRKLRRPTWGWAKLLKK